MRTKAHESLQIYTIRPIIVPVLSCEQGRDGRSIMKGKSLTDRVQKSDFLLPGSGSSPTSPHTCEHLDLTPLQKVTQQQFYYRNYKATNYNTPKSSTDPTHCNTLQYKIRNTVTQ